MKLYLNERKDYIELHSKEDVDLIKKLFVEATAVKKFTINDNIIIHNYTQSALKQNMKDYGRIIINLNGNNVICNCGIIIIQLIRARLLNTD